MWPHMGPRSSVRSAFRFPCGMSHFFVFLSLVTRTISRSLRTFHECGERGFLWRRANGAKCLIHRPYSWDELRIHAANQSERYAVGEYPGRSPDGNAMYEKYKQWCVKHGQITNAEYVLKFVRWRHKGIALEPSLAPYLLEDGIEHWILWHHPTHTPGSTELDRASEAQLAIQLDRKSVV